MGNTVGGNYASTHQNTMRAYDALPRNVRDALKYAVECWAPQPLRTAFEKRNVHRNELVKLVSHWDRQELAEREDKRRRAIGPYKGLLPDPDYKPRKKTRKRK